MKISDIEIFINGTVIPKESHFRGSQNFSNRPNFLICEFFLEPIYRTLGGTTVP